MGFPITGSCTVVGNVGVISGESGESGESTLPDVKGTRTVFVTVGTCAVMVVGPASMHEQALSKRYETSP